jgi:hypothetical protein
LRHGDTRRRTLAAVDGVSPDELDWTPAGLASSIGTLLYHTALIETDYLCADILGMDEDEYFPDLVALLPWPDRDESGALIAVAGLSLEEHLDRLTTVRTRVLEHVSALTAEQMGAPRAFPDWGYAISPAWTLHARGRPSRRDQQPPRAPPRIVLNATSGLGVRFIAG